MRFKVIVVSHVDLYRVSSLNDNHSIFLICVYKPFHFTRVQATMKLIRRLIIFLVLIEVRIILFPLIEIHNRFCVQIVFGIPMMASNHIVISKLISLFLSDGRIHPPRQDNNDMKQNMFHHQFLIIDEK